MEGNWIKLLFCPLWLINLQLSWTQRNKNLHKRSERKIENRSSITSNFLQSNFTKAAESLQELVASGPMRAGLKNQGGGGGGGLLLFPGCTSFIFLISGGGVEGVKTEPKDMEIRDRTWTFHQEEEEEEEVGAGRASRSCQTGPSSTITPPP